MPSVDLTPIALPEPTTLRELRTSKMKKLGTVLSGIDKQQRQGQLFVSNLGLPEDEHDLTFHGGIDKAIHQYCTDNYEHWKSIYPDKAAEGVFRPGGFGENLVAYGFSEENVCIGDLVSIGHDDISEEQTCVLEVSLPRQPCFKLNQRFGIKNFAPKTHQAAKTGWYYRVKEEGHIEPGMQIRVIRRPHPKWSIARLQYYVHRDKTDMDVTQELMAIDVLGKECRNVFQQRWKDFEESKKPKKVEKWRAFKVAEKKHETSRIITLVLQSSDDDSKDAPPIPWNSYANIRLPNGIKRSYSVVEGTTNRFTLGIARDDNSRGGSTYIHDHLHEGDVVHISDFQRSTEPNFMASHAIYIVGGIGITAFLTIMKIRRITNQTFELHYAVRNEEEIAFKSLLEDLGPGTVHTYVKDKSQRMNIDKIIRSRPWNTQVFVCGPQRMIDAVKATAKAAGMSDDEVFFESFVADTSGDPFTAEVVSKDKKVKVKVESGQSLLQVMRDAGFDMPSSCETGTCGTCRIKVRKGRVEHRGTGLTEEEKEGEMLCCVSRGVGDIVVEDPNGEEGAER